MNIILSKINRLFLKALMFSMFLAVICFRQTSLFSFIIGFSMVIAGLYLNILILDKLLSVLKSPFLLLLFLPFKLFVFGIIIFFSVKAGANPLFIAPGILAGILFSVTIFLKKRLTGGEEYGSR